MKFTRTVLQAPDAPRTTNAIIFGQWTQTDLGPEDARAFLRHAYGQFYHDFSNVDLKDHTFVWQYTYRAPGFPRRGTSLRPPHQGTARYRIHSTLSETTPLHCGDSNGVSKLVSM